MDNELRRAMYVAAAIQGMLAAEATNVTLSVPFLADRAVELANAAIDLETGKLIYHNQELVDPGSITEETTEEIIEETVLEAFIEEEVGLGQLN